MAGYYLKRNHATQLPRYLICFDTETKLDPVASSPDRQIHRLRLGVVSSGRYRNGSLQSNREMVFTDSRQFWQFVFGFTGPRHTTWLVAHNLIFDLVVCDFQEMFESGELRLDRPRGKRRDYDTDPPHTIGRGLAVLEDPPTIFGVRHVPTGGRIVMVDSLNWFQCSLAKLGDSIGCAKWPFPGLDASFNTLASYCKNDVLVLRQAMIKYIQFVEKHDLGCFRWTAPGQAWSAYRHRFMKHDILMDDDYDRKAFERLSYFGGRNDVFKLGPIDKTVYHLDINALYPSVMLGGMFPHKPTRQNLDCDWALDFPEFSPPCSVAEVTVKVDWPIYPKRIRNRVVYPTGTFDTVLAGPELHHAFQSGHVKKHRRYVQFHLAPLFDDYVSFFWDMRKEYRENGKPAFAELCKMFLNSLYGKFGQRSQAWKDLPTQTADEAWKVWHVINTVSGEHAIRRSVGYDVQEQTERGERQESFPAISAFVTSAARLKMYNVLHSAGFANCYYIGVDCVIVNQRGRDRLHQCGMIHDGFIGKLKTLGVADSCVIRGCGDYSFNGDDKRVGVKRNAEWLDDRTFTQTEFSGATNLFRYSHLNYIEAVQVTKDYRPTYCRGKVGPFGDVSPFELPGDESLIDDPVKSKSAKP